MNVFRIIRDRSHNRYAAYQGNTDSLLWRLADVAYRTWDLGFIAFGGPPVHFQIWRRRFVEGKGGSAWLDEQTFQELFAISTAGPGPGSTKMLFAIAWIRAGFFSALMVFLIWSLPGAIAMFALSLGIGEVNDVLPGIVYALLSGLNASTVGIIALSAVQLAEKAIKDRITRILVIFGAVAGICYDKLWYFPVLMVIGASATVLWDLFLARRVAETQGRWKSRKRRKDLEKAGVEVKGRKDGNELRGNGMTKSVNESDKGSDGAVTKSRRDGEEMYERNESGTKVVMQSPGQGELQRRTSDGGGVAAVPLTDGTAVRNVANEEHRVYDKDRHDTHTIVPGRDAKGENPSQASRTELSTDMLSHAISMRLGVIVIIIFLVYFITLLVLRGVISSPPRPLDLLASMSLAGTIIFGGGPVVIPLLRSYVVEPGWVSPRDFLIGIAIIQSFPGPNFNFGVYVGALALQQTRWPMILGAFLGYVGIFLPGLSLTIGVQSIWRLLRGKKVVISVLRGLNATAVGLVFTAVYRLWEIGYLTEESTGNIGENNGVEFNRLGGQSLGREPWWVVLATLAYAEAAWFGIPPFVAILLGGLLGIAWYGAVGS